MEARNEQEKEIGDSGNDNKRNEDALREIHY